MPDPNEMDELDRWMDDWRRIWTEGRADPAHLARLFSEDAVYRPEVLTGIEPHYVGLEAIQAYLERWSKLVGPGGSYEYGERFRTGPVAAYEWWGVGELDGQEVTEAGCVVLFLDRDGRCTDFRDYHQVLEAREAPFAGFGRRLT